MHKGEQDPAQAQRPGESRDQHLRTDPKEHSDERKRGRGRGRGIGREE